MEEHLICEVCEREMTADEAEYVNDTLLCADCMETETVLCRCCGERILRRDAVDGNLCEQCVDDHYTYCSGCGALVYNDDVYYTDDGEYDRDYPYCESCYHKYKEKVIHDYHYKPEPVFFGDGKLYMGIELEVDDAGEDEEYAGEIYNTANLTADHLYLKHDGSLYNGFELVSHPITMEYHKNKMPWSSILSRAIHMGYRSHQTDTCGLHIHINRSAFGDTYEEQESVTARLIFFYEKFWAEILRFSRRTEEQANQWASRYGGVISTCKNSLDTAKKAGLGRYTAVNLTNEATIEFRIFRGTLRYETFMATLKFTHCLCRLAMKLDDEQFQSVTWLQFVSGIDKNEYPELINYLKIQRLYINEPVEGTEEI